MKRYVKSAHNPYPTTTFEVVCFDGGSSEADVTEEFDDYSDALGFIAYECGSYRRVDLYKVTQYDGEDPRSVLIAQYRYGSHVPNIV